jgi:uncharacterized membrane protein YqgA involved in biofilm formation
VPQAAQFARSKLTGVGLNIITVIIGTIIGVFFGRLFPERFRQIAFYAIGSCVIAFGAIMAYNGYTELSDTKVGSLSAIVLVISLVLGSLVGELLKIEDRLESLGRLLHRLLSKSSKQQVKILSDSDSDNVGDSDNASASAATSTFAEGFMTASIFFCVGAMTIMGSIQAGLGDPSTLYLKSTLDGISSIALSTALGIGVGFSAITILIIQGGITLGAGVLAPFITPAIMSSINLVGGAMLIALGIEILGIKKLRVGNMLPALIFAIFMAWILG